MVLNINTTTSWSTNCLEIKNKKDMTKTKWTTIAVDKELKPLLEIVMLKMAKKMTYNEIIRALATEYINNQNQNEL
jgi:hypothetical protein